VADARRTVKVVDRDGLHARPCTRIARAAQKFKCDVTLTYDGRVADAKSVFQLLGLLAPGGAEVAFEATGVDAAACLDAVAAAMAMD
jgi:phosphotransferase system HPr (HPr) family protein